MADNISDNTNSNNERGARRQLIEELFYDFNHSKAQVYWINFTRGIFFGLGTIFGGTVLVALILWVLGQLVGFPVIGEFTKNLIDAFQR